MSGLFGIVDSTGQAEIDSYLQNAIELLSHRPWYVSDTWLENDIPVGLGRIGIGIFNKERQPLLSTDGRHVLFMCGELYRTDSVKQQLEMKGVHLGDCVSDPELALHAFVAYGDDFAKELEGAFFICLYDRERRRLIVTNDRFGLYPHYYYAENTRFVIAPEVKAVVCAPFVAKELNTTALAEYMRFQHFICLKTFHENVFLFPNASFGVFDFQTNEWTTQSYWDWDNIPIRPEIGFPEAIEEGSALLRKTVERLSSDELRPCVFLSGGLDSRTILGLVPRRDPPPVSATFGVGTCRDVYYAGKIARATGSRHYWFDLPDGKWVLDNLDLHLKLTEGFHSWIHMHGITMLPKLRGLVDVNLTGWDGGTIMGHPDSVDPLLTDPVDYLAMSSELYRRFLSAYTWPGLTEAEANQIYTRDFSKSIKLSPFDSFVQELDRYRRYAAHNAAEYFYLSNHVLRMTQQMVTVARSHIEVRFPFWDYRLIDFVYSLRPDIRANQRLFRHIITRETPRLSRIPSDKQELLPTVNPWLYKGHALNVRIRRRIGLYLVRPTLYADYEHYLGTDLRDWANNLLFDGQLASRGIWNIE